MKGFSLIVRSFRDEFRSVLQDKGIALIVVGGAMIYALFYPLPYSAQVVRDVPFITIDQDRTEMSRKLIRMTDAHESARWEGEVADMQEAEYLINQGSAQAILIVPEGFERDIKRTRRTTISAWADASYFLTYRQVLTAMSEAAGTLSAGIEMRRYAATGKPSFSAEALSEPVRWSRHPMFNTALGYGVYIVPGVLILILQQTMLIGVIMSTVKQRSSLGTQKMLESAENGTSIIGRAAFYLLMYSIHTAFYCFIVFRLNEIPFGTQIWSALIFLMPYFLSVYFLASFLSRWIRRRETAIQLVLFTSMPILFASGFAWPVQSIPQWIRIPALFIPSTSAISGFIKMSRMGADLHEVGIEWCILWILAGLYCIANRLHWRIKAHPSQ
jgi:ABC-2 type transport system permease protein